MVRSFRAIILALIYFAFAVILVSADYTISVDITSSHLDGECYEVCSEGPDGEEKCREKCTEEKTVTKSYTVKDGVTPEDIEAIIERLNEGSETEIKLSNNETTPEQLAEQESQAQAEAMDLDALESTLRNDRDDFQAELQEAREQANSSIGGDPVRLATGDFLWSSTDISYSYTNTTIDIKRNYQSNNLRSHSLGYGWYFNYDTRIIHGVKFKAEEEAEFAAQKAENVRQIYENAVEKYETSLAEVREVLTEAREIKRQIDDTVQGLERGLSEAPSEVRSRIQSDLNNARQKQVIVNAFVARAEAAEQAILDSYATVENIREIKEDLEARALQAQKEATMADFNQQRNPYVVNSTDPDYTEQTGNLSLTLIDETGTPHRYFIKEEPDYDSSVLYLDGSINYYVNGATTESVLPTDDKLLIESDGGYILTRKDQTKYHYSFYGQLERIVDPNGNDISFHYDEYNHLVEVKDGFGRVLSIERDAGKISKIIDPKGIAFLYRYDAEGRLSATTDADGDTIQYLYNGAYISKVIKPDGSSRKYFYTELNGKLVVDHTDDEEGNTEYFRYYPDQKYTEYINASGIVERYFYDDRYLTTKIEYKDGSFVEKEYDENNNLIKQTDELGQVYEYNYDENRNLIEAIDPEGNIERWIYNEFNKINSHIDKMGNTTAYSYDTNGNLISVNYPDSSGISYTYNARGQVTGYTDQLGNKTVYNYDAYGYVSLTKDPLDYEKHFNNDILGNIVQYTGPEGNKTGYEYNYNNKVVKITDSEGSTEEYIYNNRKDLIRVIDKNDNNTEFEYDKRHLLLTVTNALGETVEYSYRADGKMAEKIIEGVNHTQYEYDLRGRLIKKTQVETGAATGYEYDAASQFTALIDPNGNRTEYGYSTLGQVSWVTDPEGNTRFIDYNANDKIASVTDRLENTTGYEYDEMNRLIRETDPLFNETGYAYDEAGNLIALTDKNGRVTGYEYDPLNRLAGVIDPAGFSELLEYDPRGLLAARTDKRGSKTAYEYDSLGRLTRSTDPLEGIKTYTYDPSGNLLTRSDENGNTTAFEYDALNRVARKIDPYGAATVYTYNYLGRVAGVTDGLGNIRAYEYDELGRLIKETDPLGAFKSYEYDLNGNLLTVLDELNRPQTYAYDSLNRMVKETNALSEEIQYTYDDVGNLVAETDAVGKPYAYEYDKLNRLVREINRLGNEQSYSYDPAGNLLGKTDFNGAASVYEYDALDRLTRVLYADGTEKSFAYDPAGNIVGAENEAGVLEYAYDPLNRLIEAHDSGMGETISNTYDPAGNRLKISWLEDQREITYTYGQINELLSVSDPEDGITHFEYDPLGREVRKSLANGVVTETAYDPAGRITAIKNVGPKGWGHDKHLKSLAYLYNAAGERTYQVEEDGQITAYSYDPAGRLEQVLYPWMSGKKNEDFKERLELGLYPEYKPGKKNEYSFGLPYLPLDGRGEKEFKENLKGLLKDKDELFKDYLKVDKKLKGRWNVGIGEGATEFARRLNVPYEAEEALREAYEGIAQKHGYLDTSQWTWQESFSYDPNSNRSSKTNGWGVIDYSYNPANEILNAGNRTYGHDLNGNLAKEALGDIEAFYQYSPENRVVDIYSNYSGFIGKDKWSLEAGVSYDYDAFGRRSSRTEYRDVVKQGKKEHEWRNETNENYLYDGLSFDVLAEMRDIEFTGKSGKGPKIPSWKKGKGQFQPLSEYIYANGDILSRTDFKDHPQNGRTVAPGWKGKEYYHQDILGSTMMLTDHKGKVKESYAYDAFGVAYEGQFNRVNEIGYNGKRYDPAVALYDYGFRDYKPQIGRFTTLDPIRSGSNWYVYVNNDPVNFIDLLGLWEEYIEDEIREHLDETYVSGTNDCDIWVENRLSNVDQDISEEWAPAASNTVPQHIENLEDELQEEPERGTNVTFHDESHAMLVGVNEDGSVDVAHISLNPGYSEELSYDSVEDFESDWGPDLEYYPLNDAPTPEPEELGQESTTTSQDKNN